MILMNKDVSSPNGGRMKQKAKWVKCTGEAHSNPYIDNCMVCLPYWGEYATCPDCGRKLNHDTGFCKDCRKYYDMEKTKV